MNASRRKLLIPAAVLLGVLLIVVAVVYFVQPEHSLPSFFPGHASAGAEANHHHTKHGIAALVVALACFAFAWFQSGPRTGPSGADTGAA
jgi:uncharacterized membrane protein HdeD (DUF308 family)